MIYEVFYDEVLIGKYERGVKYEVFEDGIEELAKRGIEVLPMVRKFVDRTIPFFERRIKNCGRFPGKKIGYHTDPVELREVKDG